MIEPIIWNQRWGQTPSAFSRGQKERPLRITFHVSSFQGLANEENKALELLYELASLPELEILRTEAGNLPYIEVSEFEDNSNEVKVKVIHQGEPQIFTHGLFPRQYYAMATRIVGQQGGKKADIENVFRDLLFASAHVALTQDILITKSPWLLNKSSNMLVREANPRSILDATKIIGLFLRSRNQYTYQKIGKTTWSLDRGLSYWVLTRHQLPSLWRYFSACVQSREIRQDDTLLVGQSILTRCERAIQARDEIGYQFYLPQGNSTRDVMMYHFDYLTLLLAGALDAQAIIAHRVYDLIGTGIYEKQANFRQKDFVKALGKMRANRLCDLIKRQKTTDILAILFELRNTIHRAALNPLGYISTPHPEASYIRVDTQLANTLWAAAQQLGTPETWGLIKMNDIWIEPYTCATTLVQECLRLIDEIAAVTDVEALFMGHQVPILMDKPPENNVFGNNIRERLSLMG